MTRHRLVRNVGTVGAVSLLLGIGAGGRDPLALDAEGDEPPDANPPKGQPSHTLNLPSPRFMALDIDPAALKAPAPRKAQPAAPSGLTQLRTGLETSVSKRALPLPRSIPPTQPAPLPVEVSAETLAKPLPALPNAPALNAEAALLNETAPSAPPVQPGTSDPVPLAMLAADAVQEDALPSSAEEPAEAPPEPMAELPPTSPGEAPAPEATPAPRAAPPTLALGSAIVPKPRTSTALGLEKPAPPVADNAQLASPSGTALASPGKGTLPPSTEPPVLTYDDELIMEVRVEGFDAADTVIAYGTQEGVYLPLGTLARILDLAIVVSDDGHYASGWFLSEDRTLTINLREGSLETKGKKAGLGNVRAVAFDGELYLLTSSFNALFPLEMKSDLRAQMVSIKTLEPFPFEERIKRDAMRARMEGRGDGSDKPLWPRQETPWLAASMPVADVDLRAVSDNGSALRVEGEVQLAGDLGFMTAEAYLAAYSNEGLVAALVKAGRQDPDADLLGPLKATEYALGDISSTSMPIGLRGVSGRGASISNTPFEQVSVFDKVDLRGVLADGYEVELYRNDILVASTDEAVNGQYEFLQVPVDFGLNVFRLVFYGPQGQRSEEVRKISVGDGRLAKGQFHYQISAVQKDENLLGVRAPGASLLPDRGTWRSTAQLAYGLSSSITGVLSGGYYETGDRSRWIASAGLRTGLGGFALRSDLALSDGGAWGLSGGIGGRLAGISFTANHAEYGGDFIDETRSFGTEAMRRSTELDANATLELGSAASGLMIPVTLRARQTEFRSGRKLTEAGLRASTRMGGLLLSNALDYSHSSTPGLEERTRMFGNFDLSTFSRRRTRARLSLGYSLAPKADLISASLGVDHALDDRTALRGTIGYGFDDKAVAFGASAVRDFDRFTLALDGNYNVRSNIYSVGLRLGFSFGRDPLRGRFFMARPGLASGGGVAVRAFRDRDGDSTYGPGDTLLPGVTFAAFNQTVETGEEGTALLSGLGSARKVSVQVDTSTLPDIAYAPETRGIEIVPRPGRIHIAEFPILGLSEVEGTARFEQGGRMRGVSGVQLQLVDEKGEAVAFTKTEMDGYYFFEQVKPGRYQIVLDPGQSERLQLCMNQSYAVQTPNEPDVVSQDVALARCE